MVLQGVLAVGLEEAGPSTTAAEFGVGLEEHIATDRTGVSAYTLEVPVFAGEGPFGAFLEGDVVEVIREELFPLGLRHVELRGLAVRVVRVVTMVVLACGIHGAGAFAARLSVAVPTTNHHQGCAQPKGKGSSVDHARWSLECHVHDKGVMLEHTRAALRSDHHRWTLVRSHLLLKKCSP